MIQLKWPILVFALLLLSATVSDLAPGRVERLIHPSKPTKKQRTARVSPSYDRRILDRQLLQHRGQFASCLAQNPDIPADQLRMTLYWNGLGKFERLKLNTQAGLEVEECLAEVVQNWKVAPHPGVQPFSYVVKLVPSIL